MKLMMTFFFLSLMASCATVPSNKHSLHGQNHQGKMVDVETKGKKATVVVFLSSKCPCSNSHIATLKELKKNFANIQFVGVHSNYNEDKADAQKYFEEANLGFPVIYDNQTTIAKELGAVKTPHAFILDEKGEIIYNGSVTSSSNATVAKENFLKVALNEIEAGKKPSEPNRKTLGCYIPLKEE